MLLLASWVLGEGEGTYSDGLVDRHGKLNSSGAPMMPDVGRDGVRGGRGRREYMYSANGSGLSYINGSEEIRPFGD
jgi:hypothetical protein